MAPQTEKKMKSKSLTKHDFYNLQVTREKISVRFELRTRTNMNESQRRWGIEKKIVNDFIFA